MHESLVTTSFARSSALVLVLLGTEPGERISS
jgi:hypothetical protein